MSNTKKDSLATRQSSEPQLPAVPPKQGSTLARFAQMVLENSKKAGHKVANTGEHAARKTRSAANDALKNVPAQAADVLSDEGASMASHASAHFVHRQIGGVGVGIKGGLEVLALIVGKIARAKPRTMRSLRSSLRGTLHHTLGVGMSHKWPLRGQPSQAETKTSGVENDNDIGDAAEDEEPGRTDY